MAKKMARKGHTKVIYKGTFICKQTLCKCLFKIYSSLIHLDHEIIDFALADEDV